MRNLLILILGCFTGLSAVAQKGIAFQQAPIASVFKTAQAAHKPVFVEIYSPSCHVCQSFMPTLADSRVGKSYNSKFVSTHLDVDQPATRTWLQSRNIYVPSLPLFLYFNPDGELIHFAMSQNSTDEVIRHGNNATTPAARSTGWKQRYAAGDKSPNFLIDLGMYSRVVGDTVTNIAAMDDYAKQQPANAHSNNTNWLVLQKIILDMDNPLAKSLISNIGIFKQLYGQNAVSVAENILMSSLYSSRGSKFSPTQIKQVYDGLVRIGIDPNLAGSRTLLPEVKAYFKLKQGQRAAERMDSHVATHSLVPAEYLYVARLFNRSSPDTSDVPYLTKWINKALSLKTTPGEQVDLYYEQADALRRAGRTADARKAASRALELAQAGHIDTKRNVKQLSELK